MDSLADSPTRAGLPARLRHAQTDPAGGRAFVMHKLLQEAVRRLARPGPGGPEDTL